MGTTTDRADRVSPFFPPATTCKAGLPASYQPEFGMRRISRQIQEMIGSCERVFGCSNNLTRHGFSFNLYVQPTCQAWLEQLCTPRSTNLYVVAIAIAWVTEVILLTIPHLTMVITYLLSLLNIQVGMGWCWLLTLPPRQHAFGGDRTNRLLYLYPRRQCRWDDPILSFFVSFFEMSRVLSLGKP